MSDLINTPLFFYLNLNFFQFANCSCIVPTNTTTHHQTAKVGACPKPSCFPGGPYTYTLLFLWWAFWTFTAVAPSIQVAMRVVPFDKRTMALGLQVLKLFRFFFSQGKKKLLKFCFICLILFNI